MIPKNCRLFRQDHATEQMLRAKSRLNLKRSCSNAAPLARLGRGRGLDQQGLWLWPSAAKAVSGRAAAPPFRRRPRLRAGHPRLHAASKTWMASGLELARVLRSWSAESRVAPTFDDEPGHDDAKRLRIIGTRCKSFQVAANVASEADEQTRGLNVLSSLPRLIEISEIGRSLILLGGHQEPFRA
jgi:hypothetical protein